MFKGIVAGLSGSALLLGTPMSVPTDSISGPDSLYEVATEEVQLKDTGEGEISIFESAESTLTVLPSDEPEPSEEELSLMAARITCDLNVQHVHGSTHVKGTINGVARVQCKGGNARRIVLHYSLIRVSPNPQQWGAGSKTADNTNFLQNNRAVSCDERGRFRGWAQGVISPPAGYVMDTPATYSKYGDITSVACGVQRSLFLDDAQPETSGETISVEFIRSDLAATK